MKPNAAQLNVIIKTHKIENPITPAINSIKAPRYKLARFLNKQLNHPKTLPQTCHKTNPLN
jgi:hypothetical protein